MSWARRLLAVAAIVGLAFVTLRPPVMTDAAPAPSMSAPVATHAALPQSDPESAAALLARSPFARDRSAYVRQALSEVAVEQPPTVRLAAIARVGGVLRATLVIDGREITVQEGDATPAGRVASITESVVVLDGRGDALSLFQQ